MINSNLQDESYSTLLKLRKYFLNKSRLVHGGEFKYNQPEYIVLKKIIDDIDAIILEKYQSDTNSFPNYSGQVDN